MTRFLSCLTAVGLASLPVSAAPVLTKTSGTCPGPMTYQATGTTPGTLSKLLFALNTGSYVIPNGPCAGTVLGLGQAGLTVVQTSPNNNGIAVFSGVAGPNACGKFLQAVDGGTCLTSNVVVVF